MRRGSLAHRIVWGMRHRLFVHLVWTTRGREPLIDARVAVFLDRFLRAVAEQERTRVLAIGMVQTHVHMLLRIHPQTSLSRLVQRLKGGSARIARLEAHASARPLTWAKGYNLDSVSHRVIDVVRDYVLSQPTHHPHEAIDGWSPTHPSPPTPSLQR